LKFATHRLAASQVSTHLFPHVASPYHEISTPQLLLYNESEVILTGRSENKFFEALFSHYNFTTPFTGGRRFEI